MRLQEKWSSVSFLKGNQKILFILIDKLHGCARLLSTIVEYASKWLSLLLKDKIK